jgi:hypothetical protein
LPAVYEVHKGNSVTSQSVSRARGVTNNEWKGLSFSHSVWPCINCITYFPHNTTLQVVKMHPTYIKVFFADLLPFDPPVLRRVVNFEENFQEKYGDVK